MKKYIDARFLGSRESGHAYLKEQLDFPDYYGANLDALYDCVSEFDDLTLVITNSDNLDSPEAEACYSAFLDVLCDACEVIVETSLNE